MTQQQEEPKKLYNVSLGDLSYRVCLPHAAEDHIQKIIATFEAPYEPELLRALDEWLPGRANIVDIGGNIGNHSLYWALKGHRVQYFEADQTSYRLAENNFQLNEVRGSVTMHQVALGQLNGRGYSENVNPNNSGGNRIIADPHGDININTLDEFELDSVDLIKIDVEGMEGDVLRGSRKTIESSQPLLVVETLDVAAFDSVVEALEGLDYAIWDTHNDSPTQLMVPSSRLSPKQVHDLSTRRSRTELKSREQTQVIKMSLGNANKKYRDAIAQIQDLKSQIAAENATPQLKDAQVLQALKLNDELHRAHSQLRKAQQELQSNRQELLATRAARDENRAILKGILEEQGRIYSTTEILRAELRKKTLENDELKGELARIKDSSDPHAQKSDNTEQLLQIEARFHKLTNQKLEEATRSIQLLQREVSTLEAKLSESERVQKDQHARLSVLSDALTEFKLLAKELQYDIDASC